MNMLSSLKTNVLGISVFALITALLIAITFVLTKDSIASNIKQQKSAKLFEIVGATEFNNDVFEQTIELDGAPFGYQNNITAYIAMQGTKIQAIIFPVLTGRGYSGDISLLVGVNANTSIAGVRVISHTETPGLGDKLELKKSPWLLSFNQQKKQLDNTWAVKKDGGEFDQFTGATITPRAVVNAVGGVLDYVNANQQQLFSAKIRAKINTQTSTQNQ
ncbi:MAG: electron transport complex protein RnfG [Oceanospirillaceae bacterium]|jgi:electron transport complex protein RnfG